jgi:hypothetical protein
LWWFACRECPLARERTRQENTQRHSAERDKGSEGREAFSRRLSTSVTRVVAALLDRKKNVNEQLLVTRAHCGKERIETVARLDAVRIRQRELKPPFCVGWIRAHSLQFCRANRISGILLGSLRQEITDAHREAVGDEVRDAHDYHDARAKLGATRRANNCKRGDDAIETAKHLQKES